MVSLKTGLIGERRIRRKETGVNSCTGRILIRCGKTVLENDGGVGVGNGESMGEFMRGFRIPTPPQINQSLLQKPKNSNNTPKVNGNPLEIQISPKSFSGYVPG